MGISTYRLLKYLEHYLLKDVFWSCWNLADAMEIEMAWLVDDFDVITRVVAHVFTRYSRADFFLREFVKNKVYARRSANTLKHMELIGVTLMKITAKFL